MAEALGLLGGDRCNADGWLSSMSKGERLRERACLRLKRAAEKVSLLYSCLLRVYPQDSWRLRRVKTPNFFKENVLPLI